MKSHKITPNIILVSIIQFSTRVTSKSFGKGEGSKWFWTFLVIASVTGCDNEKVGNPTICLSFDDNYVTEWVALLPLLEEYDAKVTFFVCRLGEFSEGEKENFRKLIDHGHEIGAHGEMHVSVNEYIRSHGIFAYFRNEVQSNINQIKQYGVTPRFFALPYGEHNKLANLLLWFKFDGIRDVVATKAYENALISLSNSWFLSNLWVSSLELDNSNFNTIPWEEIKTAAANNETTLLVHLHKVGDGGIYELSEDRLRFFLQWGQDNGFKFFRFGEVF